MNQKRMLHDRIDIFFLLNKNQIVTKTELNNLLPLQNYLEYQNSYYKRKLCDIFLKNYTCDWFGNYLGKRKELKYHNFDINGEYLIIYSVSNFHTAEDLYKILSGIEGFVSFTFFQPDTTKGFRRDCYVRMDHSDLQSKHEEIRSKLNDFKIEFGSVRIDVDENSVSEDKKVNLNDVIAVTRSICRLNNVTLEEVTELHNKVYFGKEGAELYLSILKNIFLYNYSTSQQSYSDLEYYVKRNSTKGDAVRRRELLLEYKDFSYVKNISMDFLLGKTIDRREDGVFMCLFCEKKFENEDYVRQHHTKKHSSDIESRNKKYEDFSNFVDSLDVFILNIAEGSFDENPWFIKKRDERCVVYDMNHVFSGDIKLNK